MSIRGRCCRESRSESTEDRQADYCCQTIAIANYCQNLNYSAITSTSKSFLSLDLSGQRMTSGCGILLEWAIGRCLLRMWANFGGQAMACKLARQVKCERNFSKKGSQTESWTRPCLNKQCHNSCFSNHHCKSESDQSNSQNSGNKQAKMGLAQY